MSTERDELADLLMSDELHESAYCGRTYALAEADLVLSAGYRKPRHVTTHEGLDALPGDVIVLTKQGGIWTSAKLTDGRNCWIEPGSTNIASSEDLTLPATVIHEATQ